jgi:SpoVK/Ycf46/Vps4 family AAA+-type ATPase
MEFFTQRIINANQNFSLLLYGRSGTGKTAFGKHLAKMLGKQIIYKRASDLISMYVGGTEKNISAAFKDAQVNEKVLLIDEGDSFLRNRSTASRSYEVTSVNEMLAQMESHNQPFILTTNLMADIDPAAMRRFTFKMSFEFLNKIQARKLFLQYFNCEPPSDIDNNNILAPGDFACVKRRIDIMGISNPVEIYEMLREETKLKPQFCNKIGFQ